MTPEVIALIAKQQVFMCMYVYLYIWLYDVFDVRISLNYSAKYLSIDSHKNMCIYQFILMYEYM
jgi:hypothetical protein